MTEPFKFVVSNDPAKARQAINVPSVPSEWDDSGDGDYMIGDLVTRNGSLYRVTVDHTSGDPEVFVGTRYERVSLRLSVDGAPVDQYDLDTTALTAFDVGAYTTSEVDAAIAAALVNPTISGATLSNPKVNGVLKEANGNNILGLLAVANAVDYLQIRPSAAGDNGVSLEAVGADATIDINFNPKGTTPAIGFWAGSAANATMKAAGSGSKVGWNFTTKGGGDFTVNSLRVVRRTDQTLTTSATLAADSDRTVFIGAGGAPQLPTAVGNPWTYWFTNTDTTSKTITATGAETINGAATLVLPPGSSVVIKSDGTNWRVW